MGTPLLKRGREGFSLLEVLVAMVILGFVIVGVQASITDRMVRDVGRQETRDRAGQLAMDRIQAIQSDPTYAGISTRYTGDEKSIAGATGFVRTTKFRTVALDDEIEYQIVTVTVTAPNLPKPVSRTTTLTQP